MKPSILLVVGIVGLVLAPTLAVGATVAPPQSHVYGRSYPEWAAAWWQWALETPASQNPVLDLTGDFCAVGQTHKVWFLAGSFGSSPVSRSCTVPAGTGLLLPLANSFYGAFLTDPADQKTEAFLRAQVTCIEGAVISLTIGIVDSSAPRMLSGGSWTENSTERSKYCSGSGTGTPSELLLAPSVDAGYYVIIHPLPPGTHTIQLAAEAASCGFSQDVTYTITVTPGK